MTSRPARVFAAFAAVVAARTAEALLVLVVLASLVFFVLRVIPGDPAALILGDQASASELNALRAKLHLNDSMGSQYARFLRDLARFDFGDSLRRPGVRATSRVLDALGPTAELASLAVLMGAALGVIAAVLSVGPWLEKFSRLGGPRFVERGAVALAAVPLLALAPLATYWLAARKHIVPLPGDPDAGFAGLAFASTLLAIPLGAHVARIGHAALSDIARAPFLTVARAKGSREIRVWVLHALVASVGPLVTVIATQLGALLGGAVVLEKLFERAGIGTLILEAYASRDFPVLEAAVIAAGALFVATQTIAAGVHAALDPRVRAR